MKVSFKLLTGADHLRSRFSSSRLLPLLCFCIGSAILSVLVFGDGLWGNSLLAPLDIAPALFSKYRWLAPASSGVPANHYVIDQLTYDLPLQRTVYEAYHRGEIPWWDPYTFCGRPLLADAHVNGTDPVRVMAYACLPFELAYNWTSVLHFFLGGLGVFLLLRYFEFDAAVCVLLAWTYQFAGCQALFFGHPWILGSFLYYPFLWIAWDVAVQRNQAAARVAGVLFVAALFFSRFFFSRTFLPPFFPLLCGGVP